MMGKLSVFPLTLLDLQLPGSVGISNSAGSLGVGTANPTVAALQGQRPIVSQSNQMMVCT